MSQTLLASAGVLTQTGQKARISIAKDVLASIVVDADDEAAMQTKVTQSLLAADILITSFAANPYSTES